MTPNNIETLLLILFFFLPGYIFKLIRAQFKFQSWDKTEIQLISFIFNSLIFQTITWIVLSFFFKRDIFRLYTFSNSIFESQNLDIVAWYIISSVITACIFGLFTSSKVFKRVVNKLLIQLKLSSIFELGLEYVPPLVGILGQKTDLGNNFIACVVELNSGELYEGNIKHVGFGDQPENHIIVLNKVEHLIKDVKKTFPPEMEILIPYTNIKSIIYKKYPLEKDEKLSNNTEMKTDLNIFLLLTILFLLLLLWYLPHTNNQTFIQTLTELLGTLLVTFIGVYASFSLARKFEIDRQKRESLKIFTSSLTILYSELDINEFSIKTIIDAMKTIPDNVSKLYDSYTFLIEMSKGIKIKSYYSLIASDAFHELTTNDNIFNSVQQAYYNSESAIVGLYLTRSMFEEVKGVQDSQIPSVMIKSSNQMVKKGILQFQTSLDLIIKAKQLLKSELELNNIKLSTDK